MTGALIYLLVHSWKNRLLMRIRRLKKPKYLFGAIFGLLYFYLYFYRFVFHAARFNLGNGANGGGPISPENLDLLTSLGALVLLIIVVLAWVIPHERTALVFTEAEVAFLFPAPVSRRTLVHFKLLKSQIAILFMVVFLTLVFGWFRNGGTPWTRAIGWWILLCTLNLHLLGSSFARTMLLDHGISNWKRRLIVLTLAGLIAGGVAAWAWQTLPPPPTLEKFDDLTNFKYYADKVLNTGLLHYLLWPFRLVLQPRMAPDVATFLKSLGPALLILGLHYLWVARSDVAFEEASVEASRRTAEKVAAFRSGRSRPFDRPKKAKRAPFKLSPMGPPVIALLWKNLIGAGQAFTLRFWLILLWVSVMTGIIVSTSTRADNVGMMLGMFSLILLAMSFFLGPQIMRQDFRHDLPMADVLKTYPLPAWQMALGELLAPAVVLTALQWCLILLSVLLFPRFGGQGITFGLRLAVGFAVAVMAPMFNFLTLIIPNAAVLLFPGWFQTGKEGPQGIEATGQRLIFAIGQMVVLMVALIPSSLVFWIILFIGGSWLEHPVLTIPLAAVGAALVLGAEAAGGLMLLGHLFQRYDVSAEAGS